MPRRPPPPAEPRPAPPVRRTTEHDWRELRTARLLALADTPLAFGADLDGESHVPPGTWRRRASGADGTWWLSHTPAGRVAGLVGARPEPGRPDTERHLVGMWVHPAYRGGPLAAALLAAAARWARAAGATTLTLAVTDTNARAAAFYRRSGFTPDGPGDALAHAPHETTTRMRRPL